MQKEINKGEPQKKCMRGKTLEGNPKWEINSRKHRGCTRKKIKTAKGILCRHASAVTFSYHATVPVVYTCWVFMTTHARKLFFVCFRCRSNTKGCKNEKRPHNANIKVKLTRPELIGFAFIISPLEIKKHFSHNHLAVWINWLVFIQIRKRVELCNRQIQLKNVSFNMLIDLFFFFSNVG